MRTYRSIWALPCMALISLMAGCVSQMEYDATARANLQMQDKLNASQAERVKARTQVAMLRQEVLQARQGQQELQDRLDGMTEQLEAIRARVDVQAEVAKRSEKGAPQSQPAVSLSQDTLDKLVQRVQVLTQQLGELRAQNNKLQYQLKIQGAAQEVATLNAQAAKLKTGPSRPATSTAPAGSSPR